MTRNEFTKISTDMERLRDDVLSRVRTIRRVRAFFASPASNIAFVVVCALSASIIVSYGDIIHNIMSQTEWGGRFSYTYSSLMHARTMVQVLAVLTSLSCIALLLKILFRLRTPVYYIGNFIVTKSPLKFLRS